MSNPRPYTAARQTVSSLLRDARDAGWSQARAEIKPDGSLKFEAGMVEEATVDDFLNTELRMGK